MASPVLQFKRGEFANLPALKAGEPGFTTDKYDLYVGLDNNLVNNKFFGSHRYWTKETTSTGSGINLVEGTSNGTDYITLAAPDSVGAAVTYYFPVTQGSSSSVLTNDGSGNLTWSSGSNDATFTGITTFSDTTDNTLGDSNTGSVLFDGGVGIDKNLTIGGNLNVQGYSEFVGVVTFKGGTINLGDEDTDDINVAGEFISNLIPNVDDTYSLGSPSQQWKDLYINGTADVDSLTVSGVSTFSGAIDANNGADISGGETTLSSATISDLTSGRVVLAGTSGSIEDSSNLTFGSGGLTVGANGVNITGISTFSDNLHLNGDEVFTDSSAFNLINSVAEKINFGGSATSLIIAAETGITTVRNNLTVNGDLTIAGNNIKSSDGNTNISLTSNTLTTFSGDIRVGGNDIQASDGATAITLETVNGNVILANDLQVNGNNIKASDGTSSITLTAVTGNVGISSDLTVSGNLFVNGSTTQVNTTQLTVEDTIVELGLVNGSTPGSDVNKDLGILMHYYTTSAKKAAVYWDDSASRIAIASEVSESSSVLTADAYAALEIGALWVNDCAGQSQVISCTGSERFLENITIDGGSF
jgi:hypothetical protein